MVHQHTQPPHPIVLQGKFRDNLAGRSEPLDCLGVSLPHYA